MKDKLTMIRQFTALQAKDKGIWFNTNYASEGYLQAQLRTLTWMIERATDEEIFDYIERIKEEYE